MNQQEEKLHNLVFEVKTEIKKQGFFTPLNLLDKIAKDLTPRIEESFGFTEGSKEFEDCLKKARQLYFEIEVPSVANR